MPTAFVTGSTGFLGRHLVDCLKEAQWDVVCLVRDPSKARALLPSDCQFVSASLHQSEALQTVIPRRVDCIFHVAADTSMWAKNAPAQDRTNIDGTRALLVAAQAQDARRVIHVSSFAVYGLHKGLITEESEQYGRTSWVNYVRSKALAEDHVRSAVQAGCDAVIVNPAHIVGAYDDHNWCRLIKQVADGSLMGIPPGSGNFANGRKVAEAILAAYERGEKGHNYILAGPVESLETFLTLVADKLAVPLKAPKRAAWLLTALSVLLSGISRVTGRRPLMTREEAYFACEHMVASSAKAERDLGYEQVPLSQSLDQAIRYLQDTGQLSA